MGKDINALLEQRMKLITEQRALNDKALDEKRDFKPEEQESWDKIEGEVRTIEGQVKREKLLQEREASLLAPETRGIRPGDEGRETADDKKSVEVRTAWNKMLLTGDTVEYRALQMDDAVQAGYLVAPQQFQMELIKEVDNIFMLRAKVRKFQLGKAASLGFPRRTARTNTWAKGSELGPPTADAALAFGKREFVPHPFTGEVLVSKTLMRNAMQSPESIVREELSYELSELEEQLMMLGTGAQEPLGLFVASDEGISTARDKSTGNTTSLIKFDGLIAAKYHLKPQYRKNAEWLFHRNAVEQIAKEKDGQGQYLWYPSVRDGEPDRILNIAVNESEYVPNTFTTGLYVGMLGDFSKYWWVDALTMQIQILQELYARSNQVGFIARAEFDGAPVLDEAFVRVKLG